MTDPDRALRADLLRCLGDFIDSGNGSPWRVVDELLRLRTTTLDDPEALRRKVHDLVETQTDADTFGSNDSGVERTWLLTDKLIGMLAETP
ncbi:hypothetical protein [Nocardia terpenica]|uniref:Uncharacterized protein n=1 Tax=Nocardia terpenica TaxID=455432 RepID=A0A6G9Z7U3_9NOCA|nr:hypothetical protein [Nocardia terpenica]QIS21236.1 hypothetical protein F6W96_25845 [Nocardia terpenica]